MKKFIAMLLALVMVFSLAACGTGNGSASAGKPTSAPAASSGGSAAASTPENKDDAPETGAPQVEHFVIGFPEAPVDVPAVKAIKLNTQKVAEAAGGEMKNEVFDFTPEGTVDAVEKMINNGVQGVKITPSSDSIIPTILNMCEEAGVYFILSMRTIGDDSVRAMCEKSEYFLGCVYEDEYYCGYQLGKALAESLGDSDNKTYALIGTTVGDTTGDERERGLADAAKEFGLTQVAEVRALEQASDASQAVESFLASYPDLGGIIRVASTASGDVSAICTTLKETGKAGKVKFITQGVDDESASAYLDDGTISATLGNNMSLDSLIATVILVNAVTGTRISDKPVDICIPYPVVTTSDELTNDTKCSCSEDGIYPADYLQQHFLKAYNPALTLEDIQKEIDSYDVNTILTLWK